MACGSDSPAGSGHGGTDGGASDAPLDGAGTGGSGPPGDGPQDRPVGTDAVGAADGPMERPADAIGEAGTDVATEAPVEARAETSGDTSGDTSGADAAAERISMPCVAPGACDPFDPVSCGAKICAVQGDGNTACVTGAATLKTLGAACASRLECAAGLDCVRIGNDPATTCQRMCPRGSIGFCGGEYRCTDFIVGCIQYCILRDLPCDIYAQNCADPGRACALSVDSETGARYTGCRPAGTGARGDRCDTGVTCGKGLLCVRESGVSACHQICTGDGGAVPCTAVGETCSGLTSTYQVTYCR
jgi:hypothetical protein